MYVGNVEDAASMTSAFEGATAAYVLVPQALHLEDFRGYQERVSDAYAAAIANTRVPFVVSLSSLGAQHAEGTGPIVGLHNMEQKLNRIPGLNVLHLRPAHFMENLLMSIAPLRTMSLLPGPAPADMAFPWIATKDIGSYAAERLRARDFTGSSTQELLGPHNMSMKEVTAIVGGRIGKPHLSYMQVPFTMLEMALVQMGWPPTSAALFIEMGKAANAGLLAPQEQRSAKNTTPSTLEWFVTEVIAPAYLGKTTSA
jgi:uncharacterized protein YbjT (DUF2867 family)